MRNSNPQASSVLIRNAIDARKFYNGLKHKYIKVNDNEMENYCFRQLRKLTTRDYSKKYEFLFKVK